MLCVCFYIFILAIFFIVYLVGLDEHLCSANIKDRVNGSDQSVQGLFVARVTGLDTLIKDLNPPVPVLSPDQKG